MKYIVAVDMEGVACVVGEANKALGETSNYEYARKQGTRETNAAVKALFDSGAEQVIVWDNHGGRLNLHYDELDERCDLLIGRDVKHRWEVLDETFAGVLLIGYHAMDNTEDAVLCHTFNSRAFTWMKVNDEEVGEMAIDGAVAGEYGVPVIFVASDDKGTAEAKKFMPWIETVTTKTGLGRNTALSKHPNRVVDEIYKGTRKAVERLSEMKPFTFENPLSLKINFKRIEDCENMVKSNNHWTKLEAFVAERICKKITDQF
jgi:D-amino peptidase